MKRTGNRRGSNKKNGASKPRPVSDVVKIDEADSAALREADVAVNRLKIALANTEMQLVSLEEQKQQLLKAIVTAQQTLQQKGEEVVEKFELPKDQRWNLDFSSGELRRL